MGVRFSEFEEASFLSNLHLSPEPDSSEDTEDHKTPHRCSLFKLLECFPHSFGMDYASHFAVVEM